MDRRKFLKLLPLGAASAAGTGMLWNRVRREPDATAEMVVPWPEPDQLARHKPPDPLRDEGAYLVDALPGPDLEKIRDFDRSFEDDFLLPEDRIGLLQSAAARLERAQKTIGHGHFNLVSFDELRRYARRYSRIGRIPRDELDFLEEIFFADARNYGFYGDKVTTELTETIPEREVKKISGTGHYLFRGDPEQKYEKICGDLGSTVFLTSGIRGIGKQFQLFLSKAVETDGNLSQASRSLAPPGYSYHAIGDFDVGKIGFGLDNFTEAFATTDEYKKMIDLGYVEIRYTETNPFGVRHEPWHIKIS